MKLHETFFLQVQWLELERTKRFTPYSLWWWNKEFIAILVFKKCWNLHWKSIKCVRILHQMINEQNFFISWGNWMKFSGDFFLSFLFCYHQLSGLGFVCQMVVKVSQCLDKKLHLVLSYLILSWWSAVSMNVCWSLLNKINWEEIHSIKPWWKDKFSAYIKN